MGGPRILPYETMVKWMKNGATNEQIRLLLAAEPFNLEHVTPQSISNVRRRIAKLPSAKSDHSDVIPWTVRDVHQRHHHAAMLRLESRVRKGETLTGRNLEYYTSWRAKMDGKVTKSNPEGRPLVITYDRDRGWLYLFREESDTDIIRP